MPASPKTTYSASVTGGGTSINSIPNHVWTDFDLRSGHPSNWPGWATFLNLVAKSVAAENTALDAERSSDDGHCQDRRAPGRPY